MRDCVFMRHTNMCHSYTFSRLGKHALHIIKFARHCTHFINPDRSALVLRGIGSYCMAEFSLKNKSDEPTLAVG